jgi:hypothetical protein
MRKALTTDACRSCGSPEIISIGYGYPSPEMFAAAEAGVIELGGCVVTGDGPAWRCKACGSAFGQRGSR